MFFPYGAARWKHGPRKKGLEETFWRFYLRTDLFLEVLRNSQEVPDFEDVPVFSRGGSGLLLLSNLISHFKQLYLNNAHRPLQNKLYMQIQLKSVKSRKNSKFITQTPPLKPINPPGGGMWYKSLSLLCNSQSNVSIPP